MEKVPAGRCVLAFCKKKNGDILAVKLPEGVVMAGDIVEVTGTGTFRVAEAVDMIDEGPAYQMYADKFPIHTALEVFRSHWRRCSGTF